MNAPAQTNLQLYAQMLQADYHHSEIESVRDAYVLAARLFSGQFRPTGKTFLAHLIGTAGVLVADRAPSHEVLAGLLHSAYTAGEFGLFRYKISERKRHVVRQAAGESAERHIFAYASQKWNTRAIHAVLQDAGFATLDAATRSVFRIRLANEIDDLSDDGLRYRQDYEMQIVRARNDLPLWLELSRRLGFPVMNEILSELAPGLAAEPRPGVISFPAEASFNILPLSHQLRPVMKLRDIVRRLKSRLAKM